MKLHISYVFFETAEACENLTYFLHSGLDENCFMTLVVKDPNGIRNENIRKLIDKKWNVKVINTENVGYDFKGYLDSLDILNFDVYEYFILMNAGNIGPFYKGEGKWYDTFIEKIDNKTKVVGSNVCYIKGPKNKYNGSIDYFNKPNISWGGWFCLADKIGIKILYDEYKKHNIKTFVDAHALESVNGNIIKAAGYDFTGFFVQNKRLDKKFLRVPHNSPYDAIIFKRKYNKQMKTNDLLTF